jgi:hypothetical protein
VYITHQEAHRLIQFRLDRSLNVSERDKLSAHLLDCAECRVYAKQIDEVERLLRPAMKRHWDVRPLPLSIADTLGERNRKIPAGLVLAMRSALIVIVLAGFVFSAWQFAAAPNHGTSSPMLVDISPVPTPSAQSTSTQTLPSDCELIRYNVREGDTLASIARKFSVAEAEIMDFNDLQNEIITPAMSLRILLCGLTPAGTVAHPATFTLTRTPALSTATSTPGG